MWPNRKNASALWYGVSNQITRPPLCNGPVKCRRVPEQRDDGGGGGDDDDDDGDDGDDDDDEEDDDGATWTWAWAWWMMSDDWAWLF